MYKQNFKMVDLYEIKEVDSKTSNNLVVKNHYLHRKASCIKSFGLFEKITNKLIGVVIYGIPASPRVCEGVCGYDERLKVAELTRLWIEDGTPKNVESFLVGNTLKLVNREIILSYSEIEQGHVGTIYQATNFIYLGLTEKRGNRVKKDGSTTKHNRHACMDKEDTIIVPRPRKHRYVYFNCNRRRKKELLGKLKYKIKIYPKQRDYIDIISQGKVKDT